ncbi:hypothetical protein LUZ60_008616 [Juncus effusus]|nr:hypothetical protein LUZ60_008616 [Juncus effusus]
MSLAKEGIGPIQVRYADGERGFHGDRGHANLSGVAENKLFFAQMNKQANAQEIEEIFAPFGQIEDVYIMRDAMKQSRGCGFVKFSTREQATEAMNNLNGQFTMRGCDQALIVRFADPTKPSTNPPQNFPRQMKQQQDYIKNMPDDILIKILSLLDTKAAISTSILSKRWKHLYRSLTRFNLTLENPNSHHDEKMTEFIKTIQNLLGPHANPFIKSLFIDLKYFNTTHKPLLDECVLNAFGSKLVQFGLWVHSDEYTKFPLDSLDGLGDSLQSLHLYCCALFPHPGFLAFRSLKELTLSEVVFYEREEKGKDKAEFLKLEESRFELLIKGCLNLEIFSLMECEFDGMMRIDAPFSHLKEINCENNFCSGEIEIVSAPKLECLNISNSLFVVDAELNLSVKYLRLGFGCIDAIYGLDQFSSFFPCLQTLVLFFEGEEVWLAPERCSASDSFRKLKHLVIEAFTLESLPEICNPLWIALILESAPFLETFEIKIGKMETDEELFEVDERPESFNLQHKNLKEFKMCVFKGYPIEKELVRFVMESAKALGKIVLCDDEGYYEEFDATKFSSIFE